MTTTNLGMTLPTVGADLDNWGNELNDNLNKIDNFAKPATRTVLTSGSGTYNTPANCRQLRIRMVGGGGGGGAGGASSVGSGAPGGTTAFDGISAVGGGGGTNGTGGANIY